MKKICKIVIALLCAIGPSAAYAQLTTITASHINIGGVPIAAGTVTFTPINSQGTPIPFAQGGGGLNAPTAFSCTITTGAISGSCQIPDSALTVPANIGYRVQITNTATSLAFTLPNVLGVTGSTWALDAYGPPAPTSNVQPVQAAYGPAAPGSCVEPSTYTTSGGAFYTCVSSVFVQIAGGVTATAMQTALASQTGCTTAGYVWQPQSNTCVAQSGGSVTAANVAAAIITQTGCSTSGYVWQPQSNTCVAQGSTSVTSTAMQSALSSATGCTTAGYLWSPNSNTCLWINPTSGTAGVYYWNGSAWALATASEISAVLSSDTVNNTQILFHAGSGGDSTLETPTSGIDAIGMKAGSMSYIHGSGSWVPFSYFDVTSSIQTQLNAKQASLTLTTTGTSGTATLSGGTINIPQYSGGGSSGPIFTVPRDLNPHWMIANAATSSLNSMNGDLASTGSVSYNNATDGAGYTSAQIATGTTIDTQIGYTSAYKQIQFGKNPSVHVVAGVSSLNTNAWIGLCTYCNVGNVTEVDPSLSSAVAVIGFRHFVGTEATNWTCYASDGTHTGTTADTGVAVSTTQQQTFDVIYTSGAPKFYINQTQVCSGLTPAFSPAGTTDLGLFDAIENTTTTSVTLSTFELYYGAN